MSSTPPPGTGTRPSGNVTIDRFEPNAGGVILGTNVTNATSFRVWIKAVGIDPTDTVLVSTDSSISWTQATHSSGDNWYYDVSFPAPQGWFSKPKVDVALFTQQGQIWPMLGGQVVTILAKPDAQVVVTTYQDDFGPSTGDFGSGIPTDDRTLTLSGTIDQKFIDYISERNKSGEPHYHKLVLYKDGVAIAEYDPEYDPDMGGTGFRTGDVELGKDASNRPNGTWTYELTRDPNDPHFLDHGDQAVFELRVEDVTGSVSNFSPPFLVTIDLGIGVDFLTTDNTTPALTGDFAFEILTGEYVTIEVNGKMYDSRPGGDVVVDQVTGKWSLQIPVSDAIPVGTYDVVAVLHRENGTVVKHVVNDNTVDELTIFNRTPPPTPPPAPPAPPVKVDVGIASDGAMATAVSLNEFGQWIVTTNGGVMNQRAVDQYTFGNWEATRLESRDVGKGMQSATFIDLNRDGLMDIAGNDAKGSTGQQVYYNQGANSASLVNYYSSQVGSVDGRDPNHAANTRVEYGGVIGFDKVGDGYVDIAYGNVRPYGSSGVGARSGSGSATWDSQVVMNIDGQLTSMVKDRNFTDARHGENKASSLSWNNAQPGQEISGVDLNNDGTVDMIFHAVNRTSSVMTLAGRSAGSSSNTYRLVVASNEGDGNFRTSQVLNEVFQNNVYSNYNMANAVSMTWADFNGDGYMDLFLARGRAHNKSNGSIYGRPHGEDESRILFNDGKGNLGSTNENGVGYANSVHWMGDRLAGGPSLAVDWNGDGKMDVIELPGRSDRNGMNFVGNTGPINLYTSTSSAGGGVSFATSNLLGGTNTIGASGTVNTGPGGSRPSVRPAKDTDFVTGAVLVDLNWDGAMDLLTFTRQGNTQTIVNNNVIADGTALHLRIVDEGGINSLFGNTVQLLDSSGKVVAVQILNPQSGNQTNDSSGLVHFYGLDPNETYSAVLLRNINGASADVGGVVRIGGNVIENVNASWADLRPTKAYDAHVLTVESDTDIANANIGKGIVGTGYNDAFYATRGTDSYDGAGGTTMLHGYKEWSDTGGVDIIDFKLAGNQSVQVDLSFKSYQATGFNTVRLVNIEGVSGAGGNDMFRDDAGDNFFNGRGGDDVYILDQGGHDTIIFEMNDPRDNTGGNGHDTVYSFHVGHMYSDSNADQIDLSGLLVGYNANSDIRDFVFVRQVGNNTVISVDIDGAGGNYTSADLLTLVDVTTSLDTLIFNQQIIV